MGRDFQPTLLSSSPRRVAKANSLASDPLGASVEVMPRLAPASTKWGRQLEVSWSAPFPRFTILSVIAASGFWGSSGGIAVATAIGAGMGALVGGLVGVIGTLRATQKTIAAAKETQTETLAAQMKLAHLDHLHQADQVLRSERREAYLNFSHAVAERVSALSRLRAEPESEKCQKDAENATASMWSCWRSVRLAGPERATQAALELVNHYALRVDPGDPTPGGGRQLERRFVEIATEVLGSDDDTGAGNGAASDVLTP